MPNTTVVDLGKVGITARGEYSPTTVYERLDIIYDATTSASYLAIEDPGTAPLTDRTKWMLIARSANIGVGESYETLEALQAAYPDGDTKMHIAGGRLTAWDGTQWVSTGVDVSNKLDRLPIAAAGNIPGTASDGTLQDSGIPAAQVATYVLAQTRGKTLRYTVLPFYGRGGGNC